MFQQNIYSELLKFIGLFGFGIILVYIIWYISKHFKILKKSYDMFNLEFMKPIELEYGKKYPMGHEHFKIIHYPQYSSFFNQFNNWIYLIYHQSNTNYPLGIIGSCCFANISNNIYYICDLKKLDDKIIKNITFQFVVLAWIQIYKQQIINLLYLKIDLMNLYMPKFFGIVMEPNPIISILTYKYGYVRLCRLNLYKITFDKILKYYDFFDKIFPGFFIVEGYKKFVMESNGSVIPTYHIAQNSDQTICSIQNFIQFELIEHNVEIMFCLLDDNLQIIKAFELINIYPINSMSVIGSQIIRPNEFDFNKIKTYMI